MGGVLGKRQGEAEENGGLAQRLGARGIPGLPGFRHRNSFSEFNLVGMATNLTHRFSVLSGLSVISFVSAPVTSETRPGRPWSRVSRKRYQQSTLENEYAHSKTVWPVAQTEVLFLPEFSVGIEEKLKLIFLGEVNRGAFGQVFHVRCANTNKEYAMKVLSKSQVCSLDAVGQVKQEVMIQHVCSHHPFITPLTHFWQTRKLLIVMTEFVGYGELQQLWRSLGRLPENLVKIYLAQIAIALDFLHNAGIIFRDLKMENILLDADGHIKLIDFGLARWLSYGGRTSTICGTLQFMAPEILKGEEYNHSVDWWSLGIIIYSLLVGQYPVSGFDDHITMNNAVEKCEYKPPQCASPAMQSVISGLLHRDPRQRIHSFYQLQREYLFANFDFDVIKEKKISPRKILEEYIESRARGNFSEFEGLTSTPKKTIIPESSAGSEGDVSHMAGIEKEKPSPSPSFLHPKTADRHHPFSRPGQRSISSPLLHPGRLGHHDSLVKCVSVSGHNGAAMPLLQSPLLRLARDKGAGGQPRRVRSQNAVNASSLPTAVSPLLVNVRGQRRHRWSKWKENDQNQGRGAASSSGTTIATVEGSRSFAAAEAAAAAARPSVITRQRDSEPDDEIINSVISGMNGVYKKSNTAEDFISNASAEPDIRTDDNSSDTVTGSTLTPNSVMQHSRNSTTDNTSSLVLMGNSQNKEISSTRGDVDLLERENLRDEFFSDLVTSTPKKSCSFNSSGNLQSTYYQAIKSELPIGKFNLINGALIANNNNFSPLDENDFDESFNQFPWIGQSMDTSL